MDLPTLGFELDGSIENLTCSQSDFLAMRDGGEVELVVDHGVANAFEVDDGERPKIRFRMRPSIELLKVALASLFGLNGTARVTVLQNTHFLTA